MPLKTDFEVLNVKIEKGMNWLSSADFANGMLPATITDLVVSKNKWNKDDYILFFKVPSGLVKSMSIYKDNLALLIDKFGDESEQWINKKIIINEVEDMDLGKTIRTISF